MKKYRIGIIGNGYVGEALAFTFSPIYKIHIHDTNPLRSNDDVETVHNCDFVFICVQTPMFKDGSQDLSYVKKVFKYANKKPIYILKSTVLPGSTKKLESDYPELKIIFSPEFLTERTAKLDMLTQSRIILGGNSKLTSKVKNIFVNRFKTKNIIEMDSTAAELVKYMNNTFFATKVSFMNEFKILCDNIGADWDDVIAGFASDSRVGNSHLNVPGHDGKFGYGGTCFPKDVNSLIHFANERKINLNTIIGGWRTNLKVRNVKDWEINEGRSVSFKN